MPSSCCRNCPKPKLSRNRPPESPITHCRNRPAPSGHGDRTPVHRPGVALEHRQETRIDSDLVPLFRLPTEIIRPLGEGLFSFLA